MAFVLRIWHHIMDNSDPWCFHGQILHVFSNHLSVENLASHNGQQWSLIFSWTDFTCIFKAPFWENLASHNWTAMIFDIFMHRFYMSTQIGFLLRIWHHIMDNSNPWYFHVQILHDYSNCIFMRIWHHIIGSNDLWYFHAQILHVYSNYLSERIWHHIIGSNNPWYFYGQILHVWLKWHLSVENLASHDEQQWFLDFWRTDFFESCFKKNLSLLSPVFIACVFVNLGFITFGMFSNWWKLLKKYFTSIYFTSITKKGLLTWVLNIYLRNVFECCT